MRNRMFVGAALTAVALIGLAACSSDGDGAGDTTKPTTVRATPGCRAADDSSTPRMTVQPCVDLVDGQSVKVYGTEFTPGTEIAVTTCAAGSKAGGAGCDPNDITTTKVGASGALVVDYAVKKVLASKDPVDCSVTPCVLRLGEPDGGGEQADPVTITFAP
jgi:Neocarzinostatin family